MPPRIWINVADYAPTIEQCATAFHSSNAALAMLPDLTLLLGVVGLVVSRLASGQQQSSHVVTFEP
jgi:hypothetical protein